MWFKGMESLNLNLSVANSEDKNDNKATNTEKTSNEEDKHEKEN